MVKRRGASASAVCTCLYDKLMHSCFLPTSYGVCHWALQNVILMWMDSDGTCGYNLIEELFIIENDIFCKQNCVLSNFFTF